jgi:HEAT repeat protein
VQSFSNRLILVALWLAAGLSSAGCQTWSSWRDSSPAPVAARKEDPAAPKSKSEKPASGARDRLIPPALADERWVLAVDAARQGAMGGLSTLDAARQEPRPPETPRPAERPRWRHAGLEELLARPPASRPDLSHALKSEDPVVATNAAIGLARQGSAAGVDRLAATVRAPELKLPLRRAAAEALGGIRQPSPVPMLRELLDQYGRGSGPGYVAELHAELLRSLAMHVEPVDEPRLAEALRSPVSTVRLEALEAWSRSRRSTLPAIVADLPSDPSPQVRAEAVRLLVAKRHPQALDRAKAALADQDMAVRHAAIAALGAMGGDEARTALEHLLAEQPELIRAEAVSALATMGAKAAVLGAIGDKSWRVRNAVAKALPGYRDREGVAAARQLLDDPSPEVRRQVVEAVSAWPIEQAGPALLAAMSGPSYLARKAAAAQLAARWPAARDFPADAPPARRAQAMKDLESKWARQYGYADRAALAQATQGASGSQAQEAVQAERLDAVRARLRRLAEPGLPSAARDEELRALTEIGPSLIPLLERLTLDEHVALPEPVYREVLPRVSPVFLALDQLRGTDVAQRRRGAEQLATRAATEPLGRLAVERLALVAATESDLLVWSNVLTAVANDPSEPSLRLACAAIGHPSPEIRRRACEHLGAHPDPRSAKVLLGALEDKSSPVARAAVRALNNLGPLDDAQPLERLLASPDPALQLEAAAALTRAGSAKGVAALERLAGSTDPKIRRQAADAMGESPNPAFTATLMRLLDDQLNVRRAALASLPKVVGQDVANRGNEPPPSMAERVSRWKRWYGHPSESGPTAAQAANGSEITSW